MEYRRLGRTQLQVSLMGLGTGGPSRFGQNSGVPPEQIERLVRRALELGINFFDTAAAYGESEALLGRSLSGVERERYVLASKFSPLRDGEVVSAQAVAESVERSLQRLGVESLDLMQFHGVPPEHYRQVVDRLLPQLERLRQQGKFRFLGITETYGRDGEHRMLPRALEDGIFDAVMVGYNLLSPGAEEVLPACRERDVGVICMVPVRRALSRPEHLLERLDEAGRRGIIERALLPAEDPLGWLLGDGVESLPAAGYKFAAAHPAIATVLTGTTRIEHLEANVRAVLGKPLPGEDMARLRRVFGGVREPLGD